MKKIIKNLSVFFLSIIMVSCLLIPSVPIVRAQSGEGVDVCSYYSANGFKSRKQCESYYDAVKNKNTPAWKNRMNVCIVYAGGMTVASAWAKMLTGWPAVLVTFSGQFIGCMFI